MNFMNLEQKSVDDLHKYINKSKVKANNNNYYKQVKKEKEDITPVPSSIQKPLKPKTVQQSSTLAASQHKMKEPFNNLNEMVIAPTERLDYDEMRDGYQGNRIVERQNQENI